MKSTTSFNRRHHGRIRNYLLTAWYKYTFNFGENHSLELTGGIIDATSEDFKDEDGKDDERRLAALLSFDQELGDIFGAFIRLAG